MKKSALILLFCVSGTCATLAIGESTDPADAAAAAATPPADSTIHLKVRSTFATDPGARNPFWPIGWKPVVHQTDPESSAPDVSAAAFRVSSITMDHGTRFAIINGRIMQEGQVFGLQMGNQTYQITVKAIEDGQVVLLRRDQEIEVPLLRR